MIDQRAGWDIVELGTCLQRIEAGSSPDLPDRPAGADEWGVLKVSAVQPAGFKAVENKVITSRSLINRSVEVRDGDLLMTRANTPQLVGQVCYVKNPPERLLLSDKTLRLIVDESKLIGKFAAYVLTTSVVRRQVEMYGTGSSAGMKNISQAEIRAIRLPLPPVFQQFKMVDILACVDNSIYAAEHVIEKMERSYEAIVGRLLTVGVRKTNSSSSAGVTPEDWRRIPIGDFAQVRRGASPRPIDDPSWFSEDGPGWVRIKDVTASGRFLRSTTQRLSPAGVARSVEVYPGQVIMSIAATVGETIIVDMNACIHDGFVVIDPDPHIMLPEYLAVLLKYHRDNFVSRGQVGTQVNINGDIVKSVTLSVPAVSEQVEL